MLHLPVTVSGGKILQHPSISSLRQIKEIQGFVCVFYEMHVFRGVCSSCRAKIGTKGGDGGN